MTHEPDPARPFVEDLDAGGHISSDVPRTVVFFPRTTLTALSHPATASGDRNRPHPLALPSQTSVLLDVLAEHGVVEVFADLVGDVLVIDGANPDTEVTLGFYQSELGRPGEARYVHHSGSLRAQVKLFLATLQCDDRSGALATVAMLPGARTLTLTGEDDEAIDAAFLALPAHPSEQV